MHAVMLSNERRPVLVDIPEPTPAANQVIIKVDYCGICGSDLHAATFDVFKAGVVMGHEFSGTIAAVGKSVSGWQLGERVCVNPNGAICGRCRNCQRGLVNLCSEVVSVSVGVGLSGGFTEFAAVDARTLYRLPDSVTAVQGAWIEPASVALRAVKRSGASAEDKAVVFGAGPIGLLVVAMLRLADVTSIVVIEPNQVRRDKACEMGADSAIDPIATDLSGVFGPGLQEATVAFDCVGAEAVITAAIDILVPQGQLIIVGMAQRPVSFEAQKLVFKEIQIRGSFIYNQEFPETIDLMAHGAINIQALTTGIRPLTEAVDAIAQMTSDKDTIKYLIACH